MLNKNFRDDLSYSNDASDDTIFEAYYRRKFDRILHIEKVRDLERQKMGIDKIIHQHGNRWISVDEKKRKEVYKDIAIEVIHCHKSEKETWRDSPKTLDDALSRKPTKEGWIFKNNCDFIVYAIMPSRILYLLPFKILVCAVRRNYTEWGKYPKQFLIKCSPNTGYWSVNICVPVDILLSAIEHEVVDIFDNEKFIGPEAVKYFVEPNGQIAFSLLK